MLIMEKFENRQPFIGSQAWFESEAKRSYAKIHEGYWDFSDSALIYNEKGMAEYIASQKQSTEYSQEVTQVEHRAIKNMAPEICQTFANKFLGLKEENKSHNLLPFQFIDLGPGTEHKEKYLFDEFEKMQAKFKYIAVDVSDAALKSAEEYAKSLNIPAKTIHNRFDNVEAMKQELDSTAKFFSLGTTFLNFEPSEIINKMLNLCGEKGAVFITSIIRDRIDMAAAQHAFEAPEFQRLFKAKLGLLGLSENDCGDVEVNDKIEVWMTVINPTNVLLAKGMNPGDKVLLLKTPRYSIKQLEDVVREYADYQLFDTDEPIVGMLFWQKSDK